MIIIKDLLLICIGAIAYVMVHSIHQDRENKRKIFSNITNDFMPVTPELVIGTEKDLVIKDSGEKFYLSYPKSTTLNDDETDTVFNGKTLKAIGERLGVQRIDALIFKHKCLVAKQIATENSGGLLHDQYGLKSIKTVKENGRDKLQLEVYKTNHFTDRVMKSLLSELLIKGYVSVNDVCDIEKFYPFYTSIQIDTLLTIKQLRRNEAVLIGEKAGNRVEWGLTLSKELIPSNMVSKDRVEEITERLFKDELNIELLNAGRNLIKTDWHTAGVFIEKNTGDVSIISVINTNLSPSEVAGGFFASKKSTKKLMLIPFTNQGIEGFIEKKGHVVRKNCSRSLKICQLQLAR